MRIGKLIFVAGFLWAGSLGWAWPTLGPLSTPVVYGAEQHGDDFDGKHEGDDLDGKLARVLRSAGFTGRIESSLERRLGRRVDPKLAELGRLLWFDKLHSLGRDNTCAGCHSPTNGFGDTQSIAIGVQNNNKVGPDREGPRNQRRSPMVINTAFFPKLMWNGRFSAPSNDPFNNSQGFVFPNPEGAVRFLPNDPIVRHLLQAQAHIPSTETVEVAAFRGICQQDGKDSPFCQFDKKFTAEGIEVVTLPRPVLDNGGYFRNEPIRQRVLEFLNSSKAYRKLFGKVFPDVKAGDPITFTEFGLAIAEFEFTLVFADAPLDQFARGRRNAMSQAQKRGALLFFGQAGCVRCHAVDGSANEMFSDFENRVVGIPQIASRFGVGKGNMIFDGPRADEDFGLEQISFNGDDRYKFRTAPLRNLAVVPAFFHNGSFTRLEDAIRYHLNVQHYADQYNARAAGVDRDLSVLGPIGPVLARLDPQLSTPVHLTEQKFKDLVTFVRDGLTDPRVTKENLCKLVPSSVPSGMPVLEFQGCQEDRRRQGDRDR